MPKKPVERDSLPSAVEKAAKALGANISYARRRRGMKQGDLARRADITPVTLRRVERGNPTTAIAAYFTALWALGLEREIANIGAPDRDAEGKTLERARAPERVRSRAKARDLDDNF